jgi:hypothetical protein
MNEQLVDYLNDAARELATLLAQSHGRELTLLLTLENTELTPVQRILIHTARHELAEDQNAFLAGYGDFVRPGMNSH